MNVVKQDPAVFETSAVVGSGYPIIFGGRASHGDGKDFADIMVRLKSADQEAELALATAEYEAAVSSYLFDGDEHFTLTIGEFGEQHGVAGREWAGQVRQDARCHGWAEDRVSSSDR